MLRTYRAVLTRPDISLVCTTDDVKGLAFRIAEIFYADVFKWQNGQGDVALKTFIIAKMTKAIAGKFKSQKETIAGTYAPESFLQETERDGAVACILTSQDLKGVFISITET